jgi:hypothetical protein
MQITLRKILSFLSNLFFHFSFYSAKPDKVLDAQVIRRSFQEKEDILLMSHRKVPKLQGFMLKLINEAGIEGPQLGQRRCNAGGE